MISDWHKYKNFNSHEFNCSHTGKNNMRPEFMDMLQMIRSVYGKPMKITSGYRDFTHPVEREKDKPGEHTYGMAADIAVQGTDALELVSIAYGLGVRRIGLKQHGNGRFVHLGMGDKSLGFPPALWTYP